MYLWLIRPPLAPPTQEGKYLEDCPTTLGGEIFRVLLSYLRGEICGEEIRAGNNKEKPRPFCEGRGDWIFYAMSIMRCLSDGRA